VATITITEQLALKLSLEDRFRPRIRAAFNAIIKDFRIFVAATGTIPTLRKYQAVWETLVDNHYKRTQNAFKGVILPGKKQVEITDEDREEILLLALLTWREQNASQSAVAITATTRDNMFDAINTALEQARNEGITLTNRELAVSAAAILRRKLQSRVSGIAITETQKPSESTKHIEAETESGLTPRILGGSALAPTTSRKRWRTVGDDRVRKIHRQVNGQMRSLNEPFIVNGQYLMHPGDSSLGASIDNVANCRCISQYIIG
jgi:hypothetical protein